MRLKFRIVLAGGLIAALAACSGASAVQKSEAAPAAVPPQAAAAAGEPMLVAVNAESVPTPRLILRTTGNPAYTSYSPQPDVFVVDLPRMAKGNGVAIPTNLPANVASMSVDQAIELGRPLTRVTLRFTGAVTASATSDGDTVVVALPKDEAQVAAAPATIEPPAAPEVPVVVEELAPPAEPRVEPVIHRTANSSPASTLERVNVSGAGTDIRLELLTDGVTEYSAFRLSNPLRLVVDLKGVKNRVAQKSLEVGDPLVRKVRVSQFKSAPEPVARVVLDLDEVVQHNVVKTDHGLLITFGEPSTDVADAAPAPRTERPAVTKREETPVRTAEDQPPASIVPVTASYERHVVNAPSPEPAPQVTTSVRTTTPTPTENVFTEAGTPQDTSATLTGGATTAGTRAAPGEKVYTGEPIDLRLKDADIKDVLRTFAQLTGLNIAIDPNVTGTVTVEFDDVPWDQALDIILRQNGLTYSLSGNVMRVGTIQSLAAEEARLRTLEADQQLNVPLQTVIKHLSYAKATNVKQLLDSMASKRGQIEFDTRTNQIIITEIPSYLSTMLNLIETIDIPTPQVVIEARVVETTKTFARSLGIRWNFSGLLDPALGTGTGLVFPSQVSAIGGPFNFSAGNPVLQLTLGNVLGTFDLDVTLTAAENEGLARIISAPKVVTQDNEAAEIQSGVQIPIQTRVNNTTTVTYVDATLRLSVTPQITTADTVIMEITVQKTEPSPGISLSGAANVPLITRRATTKLMVRDGGTAVIGGIYQATDNRGQERLPFVSEIPVIGNLFKSRTISSRHDELLIFITPRIVRNA